MSESGLDVLVLAAFHPELAPLRAHLGESAGGGDLGGRIGDLEVAARAVGIGLSSAAVGATARVSSMNPRAVVLVGTCGAYANRGVAIGDVVVAKSVKLVEPVVCEARAAFPEPMSLVLESHAATASALVAIDPARARHVDVATTLAITTDDLLASRIAASSGCDAEHLEAHAVATACASYGVPFAACLGVANIVGANARAEWRMHHRRAAEVAVALVVAWLGMSRASPRV